MIEDAIGREKQLKGGSRLAKVQLIESINPDWNDFFLRQKITYRDKIDCFVPRNDGA